MENVHEPESRTYGFLKEMLMGLKGDRLKYNSNVEFQHLAFINGEINWTKKKKSEQSHAMCQMHLPDTYITSNSIITE